MNENILKALIQLFALVIDPKTSEKQTHIEREFVEAFLRDLMSSSMIRHYLELYDKYILEYSHQENELSEKKQRRKAMVGAMKIMSICEQINAELEQKQKTYVLLKLIEFITLGEYVSEQELDFVQSVATAFNIGDEEYQNCKGFVFNELESTANKELLLIIASEEPKVKEVLFRKITDISGSITFLHIVSTNTFAFQYRGKQNLYLNGQNILPHRVYIFETGSSLRSSHSQTIYYTDIVREFMQLNEEKKVSMSVSDLEFTFKNSDNGVRIHHLHVQSGQLVGVMGASGAGKSTLLNVLNGNLKPAKGEVLLNGYNLYDERYKDVLTSQIGYVPQDDILFEELTVYQNLYFNARLCLNDYSEAQKKEAIDTLLYELDLYEVKDLIVGNVLKKYISGGQRKRLNIALELIREPSVLFVDEPTSGLSSLDSGTVMNLLKELTLKGKIVIVNIHQPSSEIYLMFDKMLFVDKGGYLIYSGHPVDAIGYFRSKGNYINAGEEQCFECGNVNAEQLLQIIEARVVNEHGKLTRTRKVSPEEWFEFVKEEGPAKPMGEDENQKELTTPYNPPNRFEQFRIFLQRDLFSKLANKQYLLISLLEAPVLALFLGFFTKYIKNTNGNANGYLFSENVNLPAYIFMAVVVALFLGLSISAEEIIKDRKHLQRETFLGLSRNSYLNSKIVLLFMLSAIQTLSFVLVGNFILEIKGMTFYYWIILFTTACFGNMLGLNLSSALNSVITIYILIPFVLVPELLFSGVLVQYDKLHKSISSPRYVPFIGDIMTTRWAYEALMVQQYNANDFEKHFIKEKQLMSTSGYYHDYLIPELQEYLTQCEWILGKEEYEEILDADLRLHKNEINDLETASGKAFIALEKLNRHDLDIAVIGAASSYLSDLKVYYLNTKLNASKAYDDKYYMLLDDLGSKDKVLDLKQTNSNKAVADLVTNRNGLEQIVRVKNRLIQLKDPVYRMPESRVGRAHFYSAYKRLGNVLLETFWFNLGFIWLTTLMLYIALRWNLFRRFVDSFGKK